METETETLLPDIKLAGFRHPESFPANDDDGPFKQPQNAQSNCSSEQKHGKIPSLYTDNRRRADERLAGDKLGEELTPDATIWELYQEESKEFDSELVEGRNNNLDTMLLFAGLFSAVVTGFLIDSKSMLQQDPAEVSMAFLLYIAQSQQRLEEGVSRPVSPTIEVPPFETMISARLVNGLWFLSLALSLCAALLAMLAKEWLAAFAASRPHSPYSYALLHQERLQGMNRWYALHIIDLLPTMMHFSLLLFSIGLVIYLWALDFAVAVLIVTVVGATLCFYVGTVVLASRYAFCPFVTQVSKYARALFTSHRTPISLLNHTTTMSKTTEERLMKMLHALKWLAENAQDPITSDCSYQALAGIRLANSQSEDSHSPENNPSPPGPSTTVISKSSYTLLADMFQKICNRIPQVLASESRQLSASQEGLVSRYATALPHLVHFLETNPIGLAPWGKAKQEDWAKLWMQEAPIQVALDTLDYAWRYDQPYLTADTYVLLTATELRLTEIAASYHCSEQLDPVTAAQSAGSINGEGSGGSTQSWSVVEVIDGKAGRVSLFDLRARFSRALFRAALLLFFHVEGCVNIRADALIHILDSIRLAFLRPTLNPRAVISTNQQQNANGPNLPVIASIVTGTGTSWFLEPHQVDDISGLLTVLMRLLHSATTTDFSDLVQTAGHTLCVTAPVLLRQWLNMNPDHSPAEQFRILTALDDSGGLWREKPDVSVDPAYTFGVWTMEQLLVIAFISASLPEHTGIRTLSGRALQTLCHLTEHGGKRCMAETASRSSDLILGLIQTLNTNTKKVHSYAPKYLIQWLLVADRFGKHTLIQEVIDSDLGNADQYLSFLELWANTPGLDAELRCLVDKIFKRLTKDTIAFLWSPNGLSRLVEIGSHKEYVAIVADFAVHMINTSLGDDYGAQYWEDLSNALCLSHFLRVVGLALDNIPATSLQHSVLVASFICAASALRHQLKVTREMDFSEKPLIRMIRDVLYSLVASANRDELLVVYEELLQISADADAWIFSPLVWLFSQDPMTLGDPTTMRDRPVADEGAR